MRIREIHLRFINWAGLPQRLILKIKTWGKPLSAERIREISRILGCRLGRA